MANDQPVALITGASRGIGRSIALELSRRGYAVLVNYASSRPQAEEVVSLVEQAGGRAAAVQGDVAAAADRLTLVDAAWRLFGGLDVLVNNAGITSPGRMDLLDLTEESWDRVFDVNLKGPFFLAQQAAVRMIAAADRPARARKIINISSVSAYAVSTNRVDYCLTKAALEMLTWQLACRLADHNILVYEVCPGVIASDMTAPVQTRYDQLIAEGLTPIRRWGQPDDVARAVAAIAEDYFPFSTGERFNVDGGFHIRRL
jgi:3-oxoacyl-[acyl-carrier protein] reductase